MRAFVLLATALLLAATLGAHEGDARRSRCPQAPCASLERGVNLDGWARYHAPGSEITDDDLARIRSLGFTWIRLPIDPAIYLHRGKLDRDAVAALDEAIDRILAHDLKVLVDPHPNEKDATTILENRRAQTQYARFLARLADHLEARDPTRVLLGLFNEPHDPDGNERTRFDWDKLQSRFWKAARKANRDITLVATGDDWSSVDGLEGVRPLRDRNVLYDVHFYSPFEFTHQGATWTWPVVAPLRGVPYPADAARASAAAEATLASLGDDAGRADVAGQLAIYGMSGWGRARIDERLDRAHAWAAEHGAHVILGEFGVYKPHAPPVDRAAWTRDVREAAEARGMPWAYWEWDAGFGIRDADGHEDAALLAALGL